VVTRLGLENLSRPAVAALAESSTLDADELHEGTGGNPFFVTEALAAGSERVPETVRDAVLARAARLSAAGRALLDAVGVVPQRAEVWLLEALTEGALEALGECLGSGMLRTEADGVVFRHELARLAVEESLAPDRARTLHRRALAALAESAIRARTSPGSRIMPRPRGTPTPCCDSPPQQPSRPQRPVRIAKPPLSTRGR
jgi:hypothetical protein